MPRLSVAFTKRKSAADDFHHVPVATPPPPSFRVIERQELSNGASFDGGARMAKASGAAAPKPNSFLGLDAEDSNMFADVKANRGSGVSNTTNATSTDSSRHSNASTAPSSADLGGGGGQDVAKPAPQDPSGRGGSKSSFIDRATRTFSFGGQKKHTIPPPKDNPVPDLPPVPAVQGNNGQSRSRGMTVSTASTATPTKAEGTGFDLGSGFGSMFKTFDKRASTATLKTDDAARSKSLAGRRHAQPAAPVSPDSATPTEPLLSGLNSPNREQVSPSAHDAPPPVPPHRTPASPDPRNPQSDNVQDDDAKLLRDSLIAMKILGEPVEKPGRSQARRYRRDEDDSFFEAAPAEPVPSTFIKQDDMGDGYAATAPSEPVSSTVTNEDNMFEGSLSRFPRASHRLAPRASNLPKNKVMTPAQFEKYRRDKERQDSTEQAAESAAKDDDDISYDDDEDEQEKSKQQAKQRRKQEAHMAVYRQQMMKVTGEPVSPQAPRSSHLGLPGSPSAHHLNYVTSPSPDPAFCADGDDEDEDVPLGILQAHGFPSKNRPPTRLSHAGSSSNPRYSTVGLQPGRPASLASEYTSTAGKRYPGMPAFARNLPHDPFLGANIAQPAVREPLSFGDAGQPQQQGPGGLVGVIMSEERSRAMRRGSPSIDGHRLAGTGPNGLHGLGIDPVAGIPHHMMYNQSGMRGMAPQMLTPGDQAQIQMTQQMQQFMQMQMNFMQMMAVKQNGGGPSTQPPMLPPYGAGFPGNQSMADLSSRHSLMGEPLMVPRRMDHGMRTMSMVQPRPPSCMVRQPQHTTSSRRGSIAGYAPSIAPSERSNIGLPGRYRPVSQAPESPTAGHSHRSSTLSGGLSNWSDDKSKSTVKLVDRPGEGSDDDDEQGWKAMKAKREKKRTLWKSKKSFGSELVL